jgi:hypothetical protein
VRAITNYELKITNSGAGRNPDAGFLFMSSHISRQSKKEENKVLRDWGN